MKCTKAEHIRRIEIIYEMYICKCSKSEIIEYARENWKIQPRTVDVYLTKVYKRVEATAKEDHEQFLKKTKNKYRILFKRAFRMKNFQECRRIIESENKVLGYEKITHQVEATGILGKFLKEQFFKNE